MLAKNRVGIDRLALPPPALGSELKNCEVQMRRLVRGVARAPDVADDLSPADDLAFLQSCGVAVEVRVVVREHLSRIEDVHGQPTRDALEQLRHPAVLDREHDGAARGHYVDGFVPADAAPVIEAVM